ncbi:putative membrane protein YccC [Ancylobacter sp. 3268]|uniref:FUSC family protein n=1 Tax=Ancylobacter sp. 3268 TaxID=2817752 RepID=UPI00285A9E90|nr:FUSC family protein [Ancylobacter sp. 3268]MDR6955450.1 putative membrane protein YccC [Ancylobacter sp. 3268]
MPAVTDTQPLALAGIPASAWTFALRMWLALVGALYVSFWLQLDTAYSAALTVAIVAIPTRGQTMEKAVFRLLGTVIGCAASITIVGLFAQTQVLLLAAIAVWIGACIYMAALLDGNRAYMAGIGVITVALVVLEHLDDPQDVFDAVTGRGAAIVVGILAVAFVNDLFAAPDYYPQVLAKLSDLHRRITGYAERCAEGEPQPSTMAAGLLRELTLLRSEITGLTTESSAGPARSAAARTAMVNLVAMVATARVLADLPSNSPCAPKITDELLRKNAEVHENLSSLRAGRRPVHERQAPVYRSQRIALAKGARAAIYFTLAAIFFVIAGWPAADAALALAVIPISLSATMSDPAVTTRVSVIAAPISCFFGGLLKFVVLGGVSAFPLLALALAPFVMGSALLMTGPNPLLAGVGRLNVVFIVLLLQPSNPQSYDPQAFLISCLFLVLATLLLFAIQIVLPPLSGERRILWLERFARRDLEALEAGAARRLTPEEAAFRDAARIGEMMTAGGSAPQNQTAVAGALACFDRAAWMRLCVDRPGTKREP